jgi:diacylglycerol kinase family enzyme
LLRAKPRPSSSGRRFYPLTADPPTLQQSLLRRLRWFTAELAHEGRIERVRTVQVTVGNGRHYGGGMTVAAAAALDDGLLHGYSLEVRH